MSNISPTVHLAPNDPLVERIRKIATDYCNYYFMSMPTSEVIVYVHSRLHSSEARAEYNNLIFGADRDRTVKVSALAMARKDVEGFIRRRRSSLPPPLPVTRSSSRPPAVVPVEFLTADERAAIMEHLHEKPGAYSYVGCSPAVIAHVQDFREFVHGAAEVVS